MADRARELGVELDLYEEIMVAGAARVFTRVLDRLESVTVAGGQLADAAGPFAAGSGSLRGALREWDETVGS